MARINMINLSVIIIGKDVADEVIPTLKTCKKFADEIVFVDTGSTDKTLDVIKPYATRIIKTSSKTDFATWRNIGTKHAKGEWLLYIDTDERVPKKLAGEILATIKEPIHDAYTIPRYEILLGKHLNHWPDPRVLRLIKKESLITWRGRVHEQPELKGTVGDLQNTLIHLTHRNIHQKMTSTLQRSLTEAKMLQKANHPKMKGWRFWRIILTEFHQRFIKEGLWKDGLEGNLEIIYQMFSKFITYARLWELQRNPTLKETYKNIDKKILQEWKE